MSNELNHIVGVLGGAFLICYVTYFFGIRPALLASDRALQARLVATERRLRLELEADFHRRQHTHLERAYGKLMGWLYELDVTVDGVWIGIHSDNDKATEKTRDLLAAWPWETLKPPEYVASTQHYWSDEVRGLVSKFYSESVPFTAAAKRALDQYQRDDSGYESTEDALKRTWGGRTELQGIVSRIRDQVRKELIGYKIFEPDSIGR
ncbi:hypothetical protein [Saccharopolyspora shandongensis]|uniref:hypothetical protein n=1 Tax=Saccharopolyspora shandongensis TaxID=418495 RepID=UPI0033E68989